jgi:hypothetical protein
LGDFTLLEEIGRGGMGVVYRARQESMGRLVALKVLPSFAGMDSATVARFRREAEAAGRLSHPGIVPVHAVGEAEGVYYYAMELVEGPSLHSLLGSLAGREPARLLGTLAEETGLGVVLSAMPDGSVPGIGSGSRYARSCAALIAEVADALAAAHAGKVVHRDIKPSNVLIHRSGRPVLVDFGLARDLASVGLTASGDAVGTPSYMAPEQASGSKDIDHRADVYGLGALLYELLTLRPPFQGAHAGEIMRKILDDEPVPVRKLNARVSVDLETIVHTCLRKHPDQRYPVAEALAHDLRRFLAGEPIVARRPSLVARCVHVLRRQRRAVLVGVSSVLVTGIAAAVAGAVWLERSRARGEEALREARGLLVVGNVAAANEAYGRALVLVGDPQRIAAARTTHVRDAFAALYKKREFEALHECLLSLPQDELAAVADLRRQLDGIGSVELRGIDGMPIAPRQVRVRRLLRGAFEPGWQPWSSGVGLPIGGYLLQVESPGMLPAVLPLQVERDTQQVLRVHPRRGGELPVGMIWIAGSEPIADFAIARTELTVGEFAALRGRLDDAGLRGDLEPRRDDQRRQAADQQPVLGLSAWQARTVAMALGAHLPSRAEFERAGNAGFTALRYPWGANFDPSRVAAAPEQLTEPEPADSLPASASPFGVLHLCGNAAEYVGAEGGSFLVAGGHFQSEPEAMTLRSQVAVPDPTSHRYFAGMRIAKFLPPPHSPAVGEAIEQRAAEILSSASAGLRATWTVEGDGSVHCRWQLSGHLREGTRLRLPLSTRGFVQRQAPELVDGHGRQLPCARELKPGGEAAELALDLGGHVKPAQRYQLTITQALVPAAGLRGEGAGWVLELPMKSAGVFASLYELRLPPGCRVDEVEPAPQLVHEAAFGGPVLVFDLGSDGRGQRTQPAIVRFRRDGALTRALPSLAAGRQQCEALLAALSHGERDRLEWMLDPAFQQLPRGLTRAAVLGADVGERWEAFELRDVTAVGETITIEGTARWTCRLPAGDDETMSDWPLRVQFQRTPDRWLALRLQPRGRVDHGRIDDGVYTHEALGVRVVPPKDASMTREHDGLTELQLRLRCLADADVAVDLRGLRRDDELGAFAAEVQLTAGASLMRGGNRLATVQKERIGAEPGLSCDETQDWLFPTPEGGCMRERWSFLRIGRRSFLVRSLARGEDAPDARARFERHEAWLRAAIASIQFVNKPK